MLSNLLNTSYRDSNSNQVVYSDNVLLSQYYDASNESWGRSDPSKSWYKEASFPNDCFSLGLDSNIWGTLDYKGNVSRTFGTSGLTLAITNSESRGGLSSSGKWSLSGDFSVSILVNMYHYYNEYKSKSAAGLTISISESKKARVSIYFNGTNIGLKSQYVSGILLKYIGWYSLSSSTSADLTNKNILLTISRVGNVVSFSALVDGTSYSLGSLDDSSWASSCAVELEVETEQYNSTTVVFSGFYVDSGTVSGFSSVRKDRSSTSTFPAQSLLLVDDYGLSIVDFSNTTLWARFIFGASKYVPDISSISASEGCVFCATSLGSYVLDFVNDKVYVLDSSGKRESSRGMYMRNSVLLLGTASSPAIPANSVVDVSSVSFLGNIFSSHSTVSGTVVMKNISEAKTTTSPYMASTKSKLSTNGDLFWFCHSDSVGSSALAVREGLLQAWDSLGSTFSQTRYYTKDGTYFGLLTDSITALSVDVSDGLSTAAIGTNYGVEVIKYPEYKRSYGLARSSITSISGAGFESHIGHDWQFNTNCYIPSIFIHRSDDWSSEGSYSAKFYIGSRKVDSNVYSEIYQDIDFTNIDYLIYDLKFVNGTSYYQYQTDKIDFIIDDYIYATYSESGDRQEEKTYLGESINTTTITGTVRMKVRLTPVANSAAYSYGTNKKYYIDNIRGNSVISDYAVFTTDTTTSTTIRGVDLFLYEDSNKVLFVNDEGFGSIDLDSNTMEYFIEDSAVISGSSFNSLSSVG